MGTPVQCLQLVCKSKTIPKVKVKTKVGWTIRESWGPQCGTGFWLCPKARVAAAGCQLARRKGRQAGGGHTAHA